MNELGKKQNVETSNSKRNIVQIRRESKHFTVIYTYLPEFSVILSTGKVYLSSYGSVKQTIPIYLVFLLLTHNFPGRPTYHAHFSYWD